MEVQGFSKKDCDDIRCFLKDQMDVLLTSASLPIMIYPITVEMYQFVEKQMNIAIETMHIEDAYKLAQTMGFKLED
jgi:hypothetical protein